MPIGPGQISISLEIKVWNFDSTSCKLSCNSTTQLKNTECQRCSIIALTLWEIYL